MDFGRLVEARRGLVSQPVAQSAVCQTFPTQRLLQPLQAHNSSLDCAFTRELVLFLCVCVCARFCMEGHEEESRML